LQVSLLGAIAAFERETTIERIKDGLAAVRATGKHIGRRRDRDVSDELIRALHGADPSLSSRDISRRLNISQSTVSRVLRASPGAQHSHSIRAEGVTCTT
jgi:putative DNA-invertase from lambdoid prophage Rac